MTRVRLKQIGTTVAMHYTGGDIFTFPKSPKVFDFDSSIIFKANTDSWDNINSTSPYYFFTEKGWEYTGSNRTPLAARKIPLSGSDICSVVYQDGHVQNISPEEVRAMILICETFKSSVSFLKKMKNYD